MLTHLHELHLEMDEEVCEAYGWPHEVLDDEEEMLERAEKQNTDG